MCDGGPNTALELEEFLGEWHLSLEPWSWIDADQYNGLYSDAVRTYGIEFARWLDDRMDATDGGYYVRGFFTEWDVLYSS